ncbi:hypothetical protein AN958_00556, partial [Leucoagaricus sp. SymC.cos]
IDTLTDEAFYTLIQGRNDDTAIRAPNQPNQPNPLIFDAPGGGVCDELLRFLRTVILIPKVRRVLPSDPDSGATWIVMDYINGDTLKTASCKRFHVIWSARRYIAPNINTQHKHPWLARNSGQSYECLATSYPDMATWFDRRRFNTLAASAFPPWLEYARMAVWATAARPEARPPKLWAFFTRFMVGGYRRYKTDYLDRLKWAWTRRGLLDYFPLDYFSNLGITID